MPIDLLYWKKKTRLISLILLTTRLLTQGYQRAKLLSTLKNFYGRHHDLVNSYNVTVSRLISEDSATAKPSTDFLNPGHYFSNFPKSLFRLIGMVGEAWIPRNAYFPWTPDYTPFILGPCLSLWTFTIIDFMIFRKYDFGMLIFRILKWNFMDHFASSRRF